MNENAADYLLIETNTLMTDGLYKRYRNAIQACDNLNRKHPLENWIVLKIMHGENVSMKDGTLLGDRFHANVRRLIWEPQN